MQVLVVVAATDPANGPWFSVPRGGSLALPPNAQVHVRAVIQNNYAGPVTARGLVRNQRDPNGIALPVPPGGSCAPSPAGCDPLTGSSGIDGQGGQSLNPGDSGTWDVVIATGAQGQSESLQFEAQDITDQGYFTFDTWPFTVTYGTPPNPPPVQPPPVSQPPGIPIPPPGANCPGYIVVMMRDVPAIAPAGVYFASVCDTDRQYAERAGAIFVSYPVAAVGAVAVAAAALVGTGAIRLGGGT